MKKIFAALTAAALLSLAACANTEETEITTTAPAETSAAETSKTEAEFVRAEVPDLSALELLDYYIDGEGNYRVPLSDWELMEDYELFREYFFDGWKDVSVNNFFSDNEVFFNDTENCFYAGGKYRFYNYYRVNGNVLVLILDGYDRDMEYLWIDTRDPDVMYFTSGGGVNIDGIDAFYTDLIDYSAKYPVIGTLYRADLFALEPENNYLSVLKLRELSREQGIPLEMLTDIEYKPEAENEYYFHDRHFQFYPVYLVSEGTDKYVLKTALGNAMVPDIGADCTYTVEKINGEWTRTLEYGKTKEELAAEAEEAEKVIEWESGTGYYLSDEGVDFRMTAYLAAAAFLKNDKERLSQYLSEPEKIDTVLSEDGENIYGVVKYMELKIPEIDGESSENENEEENEIHKATYLILFEDAEMNAYLDIELVNEEGEWKVKDIYLQG